MQGIAHLAGETEQSPVQIAVGQFIAHDSRDFRGNLLQRAQTFQGLDQIIQALLAGFHGLCIQILHGGEVKIKGLVGDFGGEIGHIGLLERCFHRVMGQMAHHIPEVQHGFQFAGENGTAAGFAKAQVEVQYRRKAEFF